MSEPVETKTVNELIEASVDSLPRWQRRLCRATLNRPRQRSKVIDRLGFGLAFNSEFGALIDNPSVFTGDTFDGETPIQFDPANLERILQIILEYLPQILQLFLLFASFILPFALVVGLTTPATAQTVCIDGTCYEAPARGQTICVDGTCYQTRPAPVATVARAVASAPAAAFMRLTTPAPVLTVSAPRRVVRLAPMRSLNVLPAVRAVSTAPVRVFRQFALRPRIFRVSEWRIFRGWFRR